MDLCQRLQDLRCEETQNVREHFAEMVRMKEELLAAMGQSISDDDFVTIIVSKMNTPDAPFRVEVNLAVPLLRPI